VLVRDAHAAKLLAQAIALLAVTPLSFLANKLWSFRTSPR
jgi:putative flippase GtrA